MSDIQGQPERNTSNLLNLTDVFESCQRRAFARDPKEFPVPGPEDKPVDLDTYKNALLEANQGEHVLEAIRELKNYLVSEIDDLQQRKKFKNISQKYPAGQRTLYTFVPATIKGLPGVQLKCMRVSPRGLTAGITSELGFYFNLLPEVIQNRCVFRVPFYINPDLPTPGEISYLKDVISQSFDRLEQILS